MESDVYKTPGTDLQNNNQLNPDYYVVSPKKFVVLFTVTVGVYSVYWFYRNWLHYKKRSGEKIWPVMRAIFSIFYVHSLFEIIDTRLKKMNSYFIWSHRSAATSYVLFTIIQSVCDHLSSKNIGYPITDIVSIAILPVIGYSLYIGQKAINEACKDPNGESNSRYTAANIFWIVMGCILWLFVIN